MNTEVKLIFNCDFVPSDLLMSSFMELVVKRKKQN